MHHLLYPDLWVDHIINIKVKHLESFQVKGVICDLDNTIVGWDQLSLEQEIEYWVKKLKAANYKVCLISNNFGPRVEYFADKLEVSFIAHALKPSKIAFKKAADKLELSQDKLAVIGDQIFTDIVGGNRVQMNTILVNPLTKQEMLLTRLLRRLEDMIKSNLSSLY